MIELLPLILSFRIHVESIEGVTKLSQRYPASDHGRVVEHLLAHKGEGDAAIAILMQALHDRL